MSQLATLFGNALLSLQDELRRSIDLDGDIPNVANEVILSLDRETFYTDYPGEEEVELKNFRSKLMRDLGQFIDASGWRVGGTGQLIIHIVLRSLSDRCVVHTRHTDFFYTLSIFDDRGEQDVTVTVNPAIVGREHSSRRKTVIPVHDGSRTLSREHFQLILRDLQLFVRLIGGNPSTLNGEVLDPEREYLLPKGGRLQCGAYSIVFHGLPTDTV